MTIYIFDDNTKRENLYWFKIETDCENKVNKFILYTKK